MRVALYLRVSTASQSVESQRRDLLRYCDARGWEVVETFEDIGISGAQDSRRGLDRLMTAARQRQFECVLVARFDRFARSTEHLLQALQEFRSLGVEFVSHSEGVDTSTAMGKMIFTFLSAVHEFELSIIKERVVSGIRTAQENGIHCGRPRVGFDIAKALRLKREGLGVRRIARLCGVSHATIHRALKSISVTAQPAEAMV